MAKEARISFRVMKRLEVQVTLNGVSGMLPVRRKGNWSYERYFVRWPGQGFDKELPGYLTHPPTSELRFGQVKRLDCFHRIVSEGRGKDKKWFIEILEEVRRKRAQV